jgi:preprotein translocase YajC subunit
MTSLTAVLDAAAKAKTTGSSPVFFIVLIVIAVGGYFFFLKPQQKKAAAARAAASTGIEVGDEVQTIGGVIGTVLEVHGDRYTLLTGVLNNDGNLDGPQPTRIVFVRQAIARKIEPLVAGNPVDADPAVYEAPDSDLDHEHGSANGVEAAHDGDEGSEEA